MAFDYFVKNGVVLPVSQAVISLFSIEYSYGFGVYETVRIKENVAYFLEDHIERLNRSAEAIGLEHQFKKTEISKYVNGLVDRLSGSNNSKITANFKILLIGDKEKPSIYILPLAPLFPDRKLYRDGINVITQVHERWLPQAKTLNMLPSYFYYSEARKKDCYDSVYVGRDGGILEGSRTNFFAVKGEEIFTPPEEHILAGVTRTHVIRAAEANGFKVKEKTILIRDLQKFDGAFLTSTSSKIIPIRKIDDFKFAIIAPVIRELMKAFDDYLEKEAG